MVKWLPFFLVLPISLFGQEMSVVIQLDQQQVQEEQPIQGKGIVKHPEGVPIESIEMPNESFELFERVESPRETTFDWKIPPKKKGLHLLSPLQAVVDGKTYESRRVTLEVTQKQIQLFHGGVLFHLEAEWEGPKTLYPGERGAMVYRIFYNRPISLTKEVLPLLNPQGMDKIGEVRVRETEQQGVVVQEIRQEVEAKTPGTYRYPSSQLEGVLSKERGAGSLHADAPGFTVVIHPFPTGQQSSSFTGGIGNFSWQVVRKTEGPVDLGSPVWFHIALSGEGNLSEIDLPSFLCQPGFSGLFVVDQPKVEQVTQTRKVFRVAFRPLAPFLDEIPPIEFSFFHKGKEEYATLHEGPFPLVVRELPSTEARPPKQLIWAPPPEQADILLQDVTAKEAFFSLNWLFFLLPMGTLLLQMQTVLEKKWRTHSQKRETSSRYVFYQAKQFTDNPSEFFSTLEHALRLLLVEKQLASNTLTPPSEWRKTPLACKIEDWLRKEEKRRYSPSQKTVSEKELLQEWHQWKNVFDS